MPPSHGCSGVLQVLDAQNANEQITTSCVPKSDQMLSDPSILLDMSWTDVLSYHRVRVKDCGSSVPGGWDGMRSNERIFWVLLFLTKGFNSSPCQGCFFHKKTWYHHVSQKKEPLGTPPCQNPNAQTIIGNPSICSTDLFVRETESDPTGDDGLHP